MNFSVNSTELLAALRRLMPIVSAKPVVPMYGSVRMRASGEYACLSVYGETMLANALVPYNGESFDFGLPAAVFFEVVSVLAKDTEVFFSSSDKFVLLKAGTSSFKLNLQRYDIFPKPRELDPATLQPTDTGAFIANLKKVAYCRDEKADKEIYSSVCVNTDHFISTDGYRMSYVANKLVSIPPGDGILISGTTADRLLKLFDKVTDTGSLFFTDGREMILVRGGTVAFCKLLNKKYALYKQVLIDIANTPVTRSVAPRAGVIASLDRAMAVVGSFDAKQVVLEFGPDSMRFSTSDKTAGDASDILVCKGGGHGEAVLLRGPYLAKALKSYDSEDITFEFRGAMEPLIITDGEHVNVIQPLRQEG
jgi:DNA polymerase-3 subunit beta